MKNLSIIIPHYNSVKLLKRLLTSIPTKSDIEVIVVDDNSTEDLEKLETLKKNPSFKHVIFLENNTSIQSAGACRNIGLKQAKGKWVLFADADDYFTEGFYSKISSYFTTDNDVVVYSPTSIYIDTNELSDRHEKFASLVKDYLKNKSLKSETKLRYEYVVPWSKMVRLEFIKKHHITFDEVIAMNDIMYSTKVGHYMQKFAVTNDVIYCVTRNKGSLTMMMTKEVHDARVNALLRYYDFLESNVPKKQRKFLNISSISAVVRAYKAGLGMQEAVSTYRLFKKNNVNLFDRRIFNPRYVISKTVTRVLFNRKEQKYYQK